MQQTDIAKYQSTYHLTDHPEIYEPARDNAFRFTINRDLNRLLLAGLSNAVEHSDAEYLTGVQDIIALSVDEASIPNFKLDNISIRRGNSTMKFAGTPSFDAGSLKVNDYVGARTKDALLAWQALAYNVADDVVQLAPRYKYDCTLTEFTPDYSKVIRSWTMKGCWISEIREGNFSHSSNDKRSIDVTIEYDRAIPNYDASDLTTNIIP